MRTLVSLAFTILALSACNGSQYRATDKTIADVQQQAAQMKEQNTPAPAARTRVIFRDNSTWGTKSVVSHEFVLPAHLAGKKIVLKDGKPYTLQQIASVLSHDYGIPTRVGETFEARNTSQSATGGGTATQAQSPNMASYPGAMPMMNGLPGQQQQQPGAELSPEAELLASLGVQNSMQAMGTSAITLKANFEGAIELFIRNLENYFGVSASMHGEVLQLDYVVTRTFHVNAPPSSLKVDTSLSGSSSSTGSSSSSSSSASASTGSSSATGNGSTSLTTGTQIDVWQEIKSELTAILPARAKFSVNPSLGTVTVAGSPATIREMERYFDNLNAVLDPRIAVDVALIKINVTQEANFGFDLNAVFKRAASGLTFGTNGMAPSIANLTGTANVAIVSPPAGKWSSNWDTSQALLRAVASTGLLVDYKTGGVVTQNNRAEAIQLQTARPVITGFSFNSVGGTSGATTTTTTTEVYRYGYTMTVLPRMVGRDKISVTVTTLDSDVAKEETTVVNGTTTRQLTIEGNQLGNAVTLGHGETLILSGFEQVRASRDDTGVGEADFKALGGTKDAKQQKVRLLLVVTPKILKPAGSAAERSGSRS